MAPKPTEVLLASDSPPFTKMRKVFLLIGIGSFLAAGILIVANGRKNPLEPRNWNLANKKYDGLIYISIFSPDGEKLLIGVRNESGVERAVDSYLYFIDERTLRELPDAAFEGYPSWAPDSRHIALNQPRAYYRDNSITCVFDTERNVVSERFKLYLGGWEQPWSPDGNWQLLSSQFHKYIKQTGKPVWVELPPELKDSQPFWNYKGDTLIWYRGDEKNIYRYSVQEKVPEIIAHVTDFEMNSLFYPSPYSNEAFVITSRKAKEYGRVVARKLNLDTGQFTYTFDSGFDPEKKSLGISIFISPQGALYFSTHAYSRKGKEPFESPDLLKVDMKTNRTEILLTGYYRVHDYCGKRDMFVLSSKADDYKVLYLFDAKTKSFEKVFPPNR